MKRLGAIIAAALVLTIGGVYATFNYAQKESVAVTESLTTTIAGKGETTEKGTINIASTFAIKVDDLDNTLTTKIDTRDQGTTTVTFTPAQGADADVAANGIKLKLVITITGTNEYKNTPIFTLTDNYDTDGVVLNGGNATKSVTVNLADYIALSAIKLPTAAEYDAFKEVFDTISITFTVSEYVATTPTV